MPNFCCHSGVPRGELPVSTVARPFVQGRVLNVGCWLFCLALFVGCSKSEPPAANSRTGTQSAVSQFQPSTSVARLHWLGKKRLAAESNATNLMALWNLPESEKLETQTLEKLATAPWRLLKTTTPLSNAPVALLRPLLDDLVQAESYLEVHGSTNQPGSLVFAIRLDATRAALWQTNLAAVLESIAGHQGTFSSKPQAAFNLQHSTFNLELSRSGDWTLLGVAAGTNLLLGEVIDRIQRDQIPFPARATNYWVEVAASLLRVRDAFSLDWPLPDNTPQFNFTIIGEGENVRTRGEFSFSKPPLAPLEPWNIPTDLIGKSLTSFTAARGLSPLLERAKLYQDWQVGPPPNQLFSWSLSGHPMQTLLAIPLGQSDTRFPLVQQKLLTAGNQWLATNGIGKLMETEGGLGVVWRGAPIMSPFVRPVTSSSGDFLAVGLVPTLFSNVTDNAELAARVLAHTNAIYYDWEFTGPRIESWFYMGQLFRVAFGRGQIASDSVALWLKALEPKLSNTGTVITFVEPSRLSFDRFSTIGFTAFELHLFADWLESPQFPRGLHTSQVVMKRKLSALPSGISTAPAKP
jgi:hypothetical protein